MNTHRLPAFAAAFAASSIAASAASVPVYLGTYTGAKSKGIYLTHLDPATGALSAPELVAEIRSPSFLAWHPSGRFLYAVNESGSNDGKSGGTVTAFGRATDGRLQMLNQRSTKGAHPCHLVVDSTGRWVLVANYSSGNVVSLPIEDHGALGEPASVVQHEGSSVNEKRQKGPHAHCIQLDPANKFAFSADLGIDQIRIYRFGGWAGVLQSNDPSNVKLPPGSGPRHLAFHPGGRHVFVINELLSTLATFQYDPAKGSLKAAHSLSTLPPDFTGANTTAEVVVHPSGRFVYGSNRGHDSIAAFRFREAESKLEWIGATPSGGKTPRNFNIDPSGRWLLAANQDSDSVVVFGVDSETGALRETGHRIEVGAPVCVKFAPPVAR